VRVPEPWSVFEVWEADKASAVHSRTNNASALQHRNTAPLGAYPPVAPLTKSLSSSSDRSLPKTCR